MFFLDTIVVREYPEGPCRQRLYNDTEVFSEVGATCGNVTTILSWMGNKVYPVAHFDLSKEKTDRFSYMFEKAIGKVQYRDIKAVA